jgi:hypothetical protein
MATFPDKIQTVRLWTPSKGTEHDHSGTDNYQDCDAGEDHRWYSRKPVTAFGGNGK